MVILPLGIRSALIRKVVRNTVSAQAQSRYNYFDVNLANKDEAHALAVNPFNTRRALHAARCHQLLRRRIRAGSFAGTCRKDVFWNSGYHQTNSRCRHQGKERRGTLSRTQILDPLLCGSIFPVRRWLCSWREGARELLQSHAAEHREIPGLWPSAFSAAGIR